MQRCPYYSALPDPGWKCAVNIFPVFPSNTVVIFEPMARRLFQSFIFQCAVEYYLYRKWLFFRRNIFLICAVHKAHYLWERVISYLYIQTHLYAYVFYVSITCYQSVVLQHRILKNKINHALHIIASWPEQWQIIRTSDLIVIIRRSSNFL